MDVGSPVKIYADQSGASFVVGDRTSVDLVGSIWDGLVGKTGERPLC